jgi:hypothetical protein
MPVHSCSTELAVLERLVGVVQAKETIVAVVPQGIGAVLIFTEEKPKRPAKAAR